VQIAAGHSLSHKRERERECFWIARGSVIGLSLLFMSGHSSNSPHTRASRSDTDVTGILRGTLSTCDVLCCNSLGIPDTAGPNIPCPTLGANVAATPVHGPSVVLARPKSLPRFNSAFYTVPRVRARRLGRRTQTHVCTNTQFVLCVAIRYKFSWTGVGPTVSIFLEE